MKRTRRAKPAPKEAVRRSRPVRAKQPVRKAKACVRTRQASQKQPSGKSAAAALSVKSRRTTLLLEILPALLGLFGIGWIYGENIRTGLIWMIGMLIWDACSVAACLLTGGWSLLVTVPVSLAALVLDSITLNSYCKANPAIFRSA